VAALILPTSSSAQLVPALVPAFSIRVVIANLYDKPIMNWEELLDDTVTPPASESDRLQKPIRFPHWLAKAAWIEENKILVPALPEGFDPAMLDIVATFPDSAEGMENGAEPDSTGLVEAWDSGQMVALLQANAFGSAGFLSTMRSSNWWGGDAGWTQMDGAFDQDWNELQGGDVFDLDWLLSPILSGEDERARIQVYFEEEENDDAFDTWRW